MPVKHYDYEVCGLRTVTKRGLCVVCGKPGKVEEKFYQTISPFNLNKKGKIKTREEIEKEIDKEIKEWREKPFMHRKCERKKAYEGFSGFDTRRSEYV